MRISILQWNISGLEKAGNVVAALKQANCDIACLQEVTENTPVNPGINVAQSAAVQLGYDFRFAEACRVETERGQELHGNAILAKFPIQGSFSVPIKPFRHPSNPWDENPRIYLEACLDMPSDVLIVGTAHSSYTDRFTNDHIKKPEVDELVEVLTGAGGRFIFAADLNSLPDSYTVRRIGKHLEHAGPSFEQNTWTTKPQKFPDWSADGLNWRLDYVFASRDVRIVSAEALDTPFSDHLQIRCVVEV